MNSIAHPKSNLKTEAIAGFTTFFTMAYIVVVNPQILAADGKTVWLSTACPRPRS
jgi:AGZA family xanthine/uracil permease-like MFS transporter